MKKYLLVIAIIISIATPLYSLSQSDITLSIKAIVLAAATGYTSTLLTPPLELENVYFEKDANLAKFYFSIENGDVGLLRQRVLEAPSPQETPMGFFEMLYESIQSLLPNYSMMISYLERQKLYEGEFIVTGEMGATRTAETYPFRYEGEGSFQAWGKRLADPIEIEFSFSIPLEGEEAGMIVPNYLRANGEDSTISVDTIFYR